MALNRRGQVFLVGTILFAAILTGIVLLNQSGSVTFSGSDVPKALFERGTDEYPRALNTVLAVNETPDAVKRRLGSYLRFHTYTLRSHGVDARSHTVVAIPNSSGVTAIVGNFRGEAMEQVELGMDGTAKEIGALDTEETRTVGFPSVTGTFDVSFNASADRSLNTSFSASDNGVTALYALRIEGEDQVWTGSETY